jgi:bacteriocin biosynthesis cyclodehydratase domain-containing protein
MRPRLAYAFTILPGDDAVWLVAGEDVRFALRGEGVASWLPAVLSACDGKRPLADVIARAPAANRADAANVIDGLIGERVIVDADVIAAHVAAPIGWSVDDDSDGALADALRARAGGGAIVVHAQDTLELATTLAANARRIAAGERWLWASIGPEARALVGPLFLPDAGPCFECLIGHFRLRSPVPALYELVAAHAGPFARAAFDPAALAVVADLVAWKLSLVAREPAPAALYALHVVEVATLEVSSHRVLIDPECPACARRGT